MSTKNTPRTPIGPVNFSKKSTYAPLTPHTPLTALSQNAPNSDSPHRGFNAIFNSLTPPSSINRSRNHASPLPYGQPRQPLTSRPLALDNWRNTSDRDATDGPPNRVRVEADLLPAAFISTKRRVRSAPVARPCVQDENSPQSQGLRHASAQSWNRSKLEGVHISSDTESASDSEPSYAETSPIVDRNAVSAPAEIYGQQPDQNEQAEHQAKDLRLDPPVDATKCVACTTSHADLVTLSCDHVMCSSCVTAGLNIVGEKPFSCAKCLKPVERFTFTKSSNGGHAALHTVHESVCSDSQHQSLSNLAVDPPNAMSAPAGLSALEVDENGLSVLRLDDVPWNVTPAMLSDWSGVPIAHAHVLLNDEGKTLNHAYIEVPPQSAHEVLLKCRNKVLGSGKRARKVTITFSSQSELMRYLFPSWMGDFSGNQPTVANVDSKCLPAAIFNGILTAKDLQTFHRLVFHPNPRCVKDPSLPFFVLVSVINKFPTDDNSRIFWNFSTRDVLFNLAFISITRLSKRSYYWSNRVITALAGALLTCPIFTTQQVNQVRELFEPTHSSSESSFISTPAYSEHREPSPMIYHPANGQYHWSPYDTIARDLGLEPHVVQAVCQRLTQTYI